MVGSDRCWHHGGERPVVESGQCDPPCQQCATVDPADPVSVHVSVPDAVEPFYQVFCGFTCAAVYMLTVIFGQSVTDDDLWETVLLPARSGPRGGLVLLERP